MLTRPVEQLAALPERREGPFPSFLPTVEPGEWAVDPEPAGVGPHGEKYGAWNCAVLNPDDLLDLPPHPNGARSSGCCGRDGCDGPNVICPSCGAEVATVRDDCWSYVEARLEPAAVRQQQVPATE